MTTRYGKKVVATILNNGAEAKYFLPPRYASIVKRWSKDPEDIDCENLYMIYDGNRKDKFKSPILRFVHYETSSSESDGEEGK